MKPPVWIEECDALALHDKLLVLYGGASGVRDITLLKSALARPPQHLSYADKTDMIELATLYIVGIISNHPFIDGNKRTGFVVGVLFLELNGYLFAAKEEDAAQAVWALASGALDEAQFYGFMRANVTKDSKPTKN